MKKTLALLMALIMLLSLAACGGSDESPEAPANAPASDAASADKAEEALEDLADAGVYDGPTDLDEAANELADDLSEEYGIDFESLEEDPNAGASDTYAGAYNFYYAMTDVMSTTVSEPVDAHCAALEAEKPDDYFTDPTYITLFYLPFLSFDMAFTASVTDTVDPGVVEAVFAMMDCQEPSFTVNSPGSYTITYTDTDYEDETITYDVRIDMLYDKDSNSMSYVQTKDGTVSQFYEFIGLGGDKYALQSPSERALLTYKDGQITEMLHTQNIYDTDWDTGELSAESCAYDYAADSIWGAKELGEDWAMGKGLDTLSAIYSLTGDSLSLQFNNEEFDWDSDVSTYSWGETITMAR